MNMDWLKRHKGKILFLATLLGACVITLWVLWGRWSAEEIESWIELGVDEIQSWPAYLFFLTVSILPLTGFPISALFIAAGFRFGVVWGIPFSLAAAAVNMILAYWLSDKVLREWMEKILLKWDYSIPEFQPENAAKWIVAIRFSPAPMVVQNYILGLARAPFWPYLIYSVLTQIFFVVGFVVFGKSFVSGKIGTAVVGLSVLVIAFITFSLLRKHYAQSKA